ncbi:alpha-glucosidase/alpha-galactosidase [Kitasatospora sp. NE20-6]|uniref:family 4 glycosyl hydrolase n=1 Tax=Kitasatospora sp. NE20-6 TaxID=2859066 RepID=UPI0034DBEF8B
MPTPSDRRTLVLIGAGSAVFTRGLLADLIGADDLGAWDIRLVDVDGTALSVAHRLAERMAEARGVQQRVRVTATTDRRAALPGADFVVTCVGVGGRTGWLLDDEICRRHGVHQPVGDSIMPGGISRLLRTTPVMVDIARDVTELAPDALFFNYSNPMTANIMAMTRYAGASVVGLCHGMHHIQRELAEFVGKPLEETSTLYAGINHLTFIYDFRWRGADAWPLVRERLDTELAVPADPADIGSIFNEGVKAWHNPFSWEIFRRYGAFPAAADRHVTEFFPERFPGGRYYGKTLGVDAFSVPEILAWGEDRYQGMRAQAEGEVPLDESVFHRSGGEQEQLIGIIRSVLGDRREMFSVNVPNNGAVPGLPGDAAVEIPAVATARGLRPIAVPDLSAPLTAILARRLSSVYLAVEAAMTGDRGLVVEAMIADGAVTDPDAAARLTDDLLAAQAHHLPGFE